MRNLFICILFLILTFSLFANVSGDLLEKAQSGDSESQFQLAKVLDAGIGVEPDPPKAAEWYYKAAVQGHADAAEFLATLYEEGIGLDKDPILAAEWKSFAGKVRRNPESIPSIKLPDFYKGNGTKSTSTSESIDEIERKIAELQKLKEKIKLNSKKGNNNRSYPTVTPTVDSKVVYKLTDLDRAPKLLRVSRPSYPASLKSSGIEGTVRLLVQIDSRGKVKVEGVFSSPHRLMSEAAILAAEKSLYEPPRRNGLAVRAKFSLPVPFSIEKDKLDPFIIAKEASAMSFFFNIANIKKSVIGREVTSHPWIEKYDLILMEFFDSTLADIDKNYRSVETLSFCFYSLGDNYFEDAMEGLNPSIKDSEFLASIRFNNRIEEKDFRTSIIKDNYSVEEFQGALITNELNDITNPLPNDCVFGMKNLQSDESIVAIGNRHMIQHRLGKKKKISFTYDAFELLSSQPAVAVAARFPSGSFGSIAVKMSLDPASKIFSGTVRKLVGFAFSIELATQIKTRLILKFDDYKTAKSLQQIINLMRTPESLRAMPPLFKKFQFNQSENLFTIDLDLSVEEFKDLLDLMT
jgi:TonB family protein